MGAQLVDDAGRQSLPRRVVAPGAQVVLGLLDPGSHDVEHLDGLLDDLGADPVTRDDSQFHCAVPRVAPLLPSERSTNSSVKAPTSVPMESSTSAGTC